MVAVFLLLALLLAGCKTTLQRDTDQTLSTGEILKRSTHLFIGKIERHSVPTDSPFRLSWKDEKDWKIVSRRVRVELVLRGIETNQTIDIYEVFWSHGLVGPWNATQDGGRYLFPVQKVNGHYRLTRDFWHSIYSVRSGRHDRLPMDDSRPFLERFALLQYWPGPDRSRGITNMWVGELGFWRDVKLLRGLLRHPDRTVRLDACEELLHLQMAQDECWDQLTAHEQAGLNLFRNALDPKEIREANRRFERESQQLWETYASRGKQDFGLLQLFTTIRDRTLRSHFCRLFQQRFPEETEHGCPATRPPPASYVTEAGDVPLVGDWPSR